MRYVIVLCRFAFAATLIISCSKGSTGFILSRGLDTSKLYFVIPDSPGGMAPTARYGDEPDRSYKKNEIKQPLNGIPQGQYQVQENDHDIVVKDVQVPSADVQYYQQTLDENNVIVINPNSFSENFIKRNQLEIGSFNPYEVDQGIIIAENKEEHSDEEVNREAIVPKKREEENLRNEVYDEDFFLSVIPLAKPPTKSNVESS